MGLFGKSKNRKQQQREEEPKLLDQQEEPIMPVSNMTTEPLPVADDAASCVTGTCSPQESTGTDTSSPVLQNTSSRERTWSLDIAGYNVNVSPQELAVGAAATTILLALGLLGLWIRKRSRRSRERMRLSFLHDNQAILGRIEEMNLELESKDETVDLLKQELANAHAQANDQEMMAAKLLEQKEYQIDELKSTIEHIKDQQQNSEARLDLVTNELKKYVEEKADHECQLLEHKLAAQQLQHVVSEREAQLEETKRINQELTYANASSQERIHALEHRIKADAQKAEKIINNLMAERDGRFDVLQQENEAIKATVMGLLKQTQERFDADKAAMKRELKHRDEKVGKLQRELWESNKLLKSLQGEKRPMSASTRKLIDDMDTPNEAPTMKRQSSTARLVDEIMATDEPEEAAQLKNMLASSETNLLKTPEKKPRSSAHTPTSVAEF